MRPQNYSYAVALSIIFTLLLSGVAYAGIGQRAGQLNFGKIPLGDQKTLPFTVINTDPVPMPIAIETEGDFLKYATVEPQRTVIPAGGEYNFQVTFYMPRDAKEGTEFNGKVRAKSDYDSTPQGAVGVGLQLAVLKEGKAVATTEAAIPAEVPFPLITVVGLLILVALLVIPLGLLKRRSR